MNKKSICWWLGLVAAMLTAAVTYCSCTAGISVGKSNRVEQTVTNMIDSTSTTISILPR